MIKVGIVCEYNPFHEGHLHQIKKVKEMFGQDVAIIAIMSGNFVQRGQGAIMDKWARTKAAILAGGVSVVIELPVLFATNSAQYFADGAISLIDATGVCDYLVFGGESSNLDELRKIACVLAKEPLAYKTKLKEFLKSGLSYPASVQGALCEFDSNLNAKEILHGSNNILALEYLKALEKREIKNIKPIVILRKGQNYLDENTPLKEEIWSASAIRKTVEEQKGDFRQVLIDLSNAMPILSLSELLENIKNSTYLCSQNILSNTIITILLATSKDDIENLPGMGEGLGVRLKESARKVTDLNNPINEIVENSYSKRFPKSRVQRALIHMLLGIKKEDISYVTNGGAPTYIRVLGFDKKGQYILKLMRKKSKLPIIMNASDFLSLPNSNENYSKRLYQLDLLASDIYSLHTNGVCGKDFTMPPIRVLKRPKM